MTRSIDAPAARRRVRQARKAQHDARLDAQRAAYKMRGRGETYASIAKALGVTDMTARSWVYAEVRCLNANDIDRARRTGVIHQDDSRQPADWLMYLDPRRIADAKRRGWNPAGIEMMLDAFHGDDDLLWDLCDELDIEPAHLVMLTGYEGPGVDLPAVCREYIPRLKAAGCRDFHEMEQVIDDCPIEDQLDRRLAAIGTDGDLFCRLCDVGCDGLGVEAGLRDGVIDRRDGRRLARQLEAMSDDERRKHFAQVDNWLHGLSRRPRLPTAPTKKSHHDPDTRRGKKQKG